MNISKTVINNKNIAVVSAKNVVINDIKSTLNLLSTARNVYDCDNIVIQKDVIDDSFFNITSRLAKEVLHKVINYKFKFAIVGDFSFCTKRMKEFINKSNNGNAVFFLDNKQQAINRLANTNA